MYFSCSSHEDECRVDTSYDSDNDFDFDRYEPIKDVGNDHKVAAISFRLSQISFHDLQCMHHGVTALRWESSTSHNAPVYLHLENDSRVLSWSRPTWSALRGPAGTSSPDYVFMGELNPLISPALAARYQLQMMHRLDEFDDGFVDLSTVKDLTFGSSCAIDIAAVGKGLNSTSVSKAKNCFTILFGTNMSDNRIVEFVLPARTATIWRRGLTKLVKAAQYQVKKCVDKRLFWLKEQYLQLYFEGSRCHGPTPGEAIRVCKGLELFCLC